MTVPNHSWRKFKNRLMQVIACSCAVLVIVPLLLVFYYLVKSGISSINWAFFTQLPKPTGEPGGGMANAIVGTLILLAQAALIGVPIGVLGGVFLSEYGSSSLNWGIRFGADVLNGVPSIVWGIVVSAMIVVPISEPFHGKIESLNTKYNLVAVHNSADETRKFLVNKKTEINLQGQHQFDSLLKGADVFVKYHQTDEGLMVADKVEPVSLWQLFVAKLIHLHNSVSGFSALAGGIVLGFMMIPMIMRTTEEVLQLVPQGYREASLALGISKWRTIVQIIIRTALKGIATGTLLALARVAGETAPLLFTALGNLGWAHKLTEPIDALPLRIFAYAISPYDDWHRQAQAGALLLLLFVLFINISVRFLTRDRFQKKA